jgi:hypothetical protein
MRIVVKMRITQKVVVIKWNHKFGIIPIPPMNVSLARLIIVSFVTKLMSALFAIKGIY